MADEEARDLPIFDAAIIAGRADHHTSIHGSSEYFVEMKYAGCLVALVLP